MYNVYVSCIIMHIIILYNAGNVEVKLCVQSCQLGSANTCNCHENEPCCARNIGDIEIWLSDWKVHFLGQCGTSE